MMLISFQLILLPILGPFALILMGAGAGYYALM